MSKRILIVDDDPTVRSVLREFLETNGHAAETVETGREALTKLEQASYDAVVTDYNLPEVNGLAVLRHARQYQPSIPVVMMTGESRSHLAVEALAALGAQACLFKPFAPQELTQALGESSGTFGGNKGTVSSEHPAGVGTSTYGQVTGNPVSEPAKPRSGGTLPDTSA
jgi:CheY-like chemotaxis protein